MKLTICIGSSCHVKGSGKVVERIKALISEAGIQDKIELGGTFCMGRCKEGVCVSIDDEDFSVSPDTVDEFFENNVLTRVK